MARDGTNRGDAASAQAPNPSPWQTAWLTAAPTESWLPMRCPSPMTSPVPTPTKAARSSFRSVCLRPMRSRSRGSSNARKPFPISGCWVSTRQRVLRSRPRLWPCRRVFRSRRMCCGTRFSTSSKPTAPRPHPHGNNVEKYQALGSRESPFWALTGVR